MLDVSASAGRSIAPERHRVVAQVLHPECRVEAGPEDGRLPLQPRGEVLLAAPAGEVGHAQLRFVDVALHLGQGDGCLHRPAGPITHRVPRILPALVQQAERRPALVFDEPVAVQVPVAVDPLEGGQGVRPQAVHEGHVTGPGERLAEEDQPQRGGIDRAVVAAEGQFAGTGHLAGPQLVQHLAGVRIVGRVVDRRLPGRQDLQRADREGRPHGDGLVRGDEGIAPEERGEPRHARGQVVLTRARALVEQQPQVGHAPPDEPVERLVVGGYGGHALAPTAIRGGRDRLLHRRWSAGAHGQRRRAVRVGQLIRPDGPGQLDGPARFDGAAPADDQGGPVGARPIGGRPDVAVGEGDLRTPQDMVEPAITKDHASRRHEDGQARAHPLALVAAHLEDVGRVRRQRQLDGEPFLALREIGDDQPLAQCAVDDPMAGDAERLVGQHRVAGHLVGRIAPQVGVGELDRAAEVVRGVAAQEGRPQAVDRHLGAGQDARVAVVEPQPSGPGVDVAEEIRQEVEVAVLEDAHPAEVGRVDDRPLGGRDGPGGGLGAGHRP